MKLTVWIFLVIGVGLGVEEIEKSASEIAGKLMSPCCWTQTVDVHTSDISQEMQQEIRDLLRSGKKKDEIIAHYVSLYGTRILAIPPASGFNLAVFVLPSLFFILGGWSVFYVVKHWKTGRVVEAVKLEAAEIEAGYAERLALDLRKRD